MKKYFIILCAVVCAVACVKENVVSNDLPEEQDLYSGNQDVISYKAARYLAYCELESGSSSFINLSGDYELSERPRVIYDYDNLPKLYEFDIIQNGKVSASITTYAKKEDNGVIAYMFEKAQSSESEGFDTFVGNYPDVYYGKRTSVGVPPVDLCLSDRKTRVAVPVMTKAVADDDVWAPYYELLDRMDEENRAATLATIAEMKDSEEAAEVSCAAVSEYWESLEDVIEEVNGYSDAEINRALVASKREITTKGGGIKPNAGDLYGSNPSSYYIIPRYNDENLKRTRWEGACGPSAVSWMYRGLYQNYPYNTTQYLPIYGDPNEYKTGTFGHYTPMDDGPGAYRFAVYKDTTGVKQSDHGLYLKVEKRCGPSGELYEAGLKNAVEEVTSQKYKAVTTAYSHKAVKNNSPVFIMAVMDGKAHYFLAIGYGTSGTKKYIYIMDNGSMTKNNTNHRYYPYWHKETSNYGLRYKVVKK